jgi:uncharacterized protein YbjT (DUF2867 family)
MPEIQELVEAGSFCWNEACDAFGERAATLTNAAGGFTIRAPEAGRYSLRAERIGYATVTSPAFDRRRPEEALSTLMGDTTHFRTFALTHFRTSALSHFRHIPSRPDVPQCLRRCSGPAPALHRP